MGRVLYEVWYPGGNYFFFPKKCSLILLTCLIDSSSRNVFSDNLLCHNCCFEIISFLLHNLLGRNHEEILLNAIDFKSSIFRCNTLTVLLKGDFNVTAPLSFIWAMKARGLTLCSWTAVDLFSVQSSPTSLVAALWCAHSGMSLWLWPVVTLGLSGRQ